MESVGATLFTTNPLPILSPKFPDLSIEIEWFQNIIREITRR